MNLKRNMYTLQERVRLEIAPMNAGNICISSYILKPHF